MLNNLITEFSREINKESLNLVRNGLNLNKLINLQKSFINKHNDLMYMHEMIAYIDDYLTHLNELRVLYPKKQYEECYVPIN
jgi:cobalamin biosynthesis Co2+ chelatase CbiK